jgi:hypothetical protein
LARCLGTVKLGVLREVRWETPKGWRWTVEEPVEPALVFDPPTVASLTRQFIGLPSWARPPVVATATDTGMATHRAWLDERVRQLSKSQQPEFISRLRSPGQYFQSTVELALGVVLSAAGFSVEYGPLLQGQTPDVRATDAEGRQSIFEVWTRSVPSSNTAQLRQWGALAQRIAKVCVPVLLAVDSAERDATDPPSPSEVLVIAKTLARWLRSGDYRTRHVCHVAGYHFTVYGQANGTSVEMLPVVPATYADSRHVWDAVNEKVKKYRKAVNAAELPFVVVLSGEPRSGLDRGLVESALSGANTLSLNFDIRTFGAMEGRPFEFRRTEAPPAFDPCLSAVGWIDAPPVSQPHLALWSTHSAARALPVIDHEGVSAERAI